MRYLYIMIASAISTACLGQTSEHDLLQFLQIDTSWEMTHYSGKLQGCISTDLWLAEKRDSTVGAWRVADLPLYSLEEIENTPGSYYEYDSENNFTGTVSLQEVSHNGYSGFWQNVQSTRALHLRFSNSSIKDEFTWSKYTNRDQSETYVLESPITTEVYQYRRDGKLEKYVGDKTGASYYINLNFPASYKSLKIRNYTDDSRILTAKNQLAFKSEIFNYCSATKDQIQIIRMPQELKDMSDQLSTFTSDSISEIDGRFSEIIYQWFVPFYASEEWLSGMLITSVNDRNSTEYLNYNVAEKQRIEMNDIIRNSEDLYKITEKIKKENYARCFEADTKHEKLCRFIRSQDFRNYNISAFGILASTEYTDEFGTVSFLIPYSEIKSEFRWFHPIKTIVRDGNN